MRNCYIILPYKIKQILFVSHISQQTDIPLKLQWVGYNDEHAKKEEYVTSERNDSLAFSLYPSPRPENISVQMLHVNTTGDFKWNSKAMQNRGMSSLQLFSIFIYTHPIILLKLLQQTSCQFHSYNIWPSFSTKQQFFVALFFHFKTHLNYIWNWSLHYILQYDSKC